MTQQERINRIQSPVARRLLQEWHDSLLDLFGDEHGSVGEMLAANERRKREAEESEYRKNKRTKEEKIEFYAAQVASWGDEENEIEFDEDEDKLYNNQRLFARLMIEQGILTNEDFEE